MIEKNAQNKIFFISGSIIFIVIFIGTVFIYKPFILKKEGLKNKIQEETKRNLYLAQIKLIKEHVDLYEKRLPERKSVSWLLEEVSRIASESALELISIKPEGPEERGNFTKLPIRIEAHSTYHELGKFLSQLESSKKFFKIEDLQLKRVEEEGGKDTAKSFKIRANILMSSIILKE